MMVRSTSGTSSRHSNRVELVRPSSKPVLLQPRRPTLAHKPKSIPPIAGIRILRLQAPLIGEQDEFDGTFPLAGRIRNGLQLVRDGLPALWVGVVRLEDVGLYRRQCGSSTLAVRYRSSL